MQQEDINQLTSSRSVGMRDIAKQLYPGLRHSGMTSNFNSPLIRTSSTFLLEGEGAPSTWRERAECVSTGVRGIFKEEALNKNDFRAPLRSGFTLIELLVVVLIIGILAAIALPQYQKAVEKSHAVEAQLILKEVYKSAQLYFLTHGTYPSSFSELDSAPAWTGREKYYDYSGSVIDVRSNENWSLNLFYNATISIARLAGPYKGAGFSIQSASDKYPKHQMMCFEAAAVTPMIQVRFAKDAGDYCNKIIHADRLPGTDSHTYYQLH